MLTIGCQEHHRNIRRYYLQDIFETIFRVEEKKLTYYVCLLFFWRAGVCAGRLHWLWRRRSYRPTKPMFRLYSYFCICIRFLYTTSYKLHATSYKLHAAPPPPLPPPPPSYPTLPHLYLTLNTTVTVRDEEIAVSLYTDRIVTTYQQ